MDTSRSPETWTQEARMARRFVVRGVVQGVGFRPFVYRLAHECGIDGWVNNSTLGVVVEAEGPSERLDDFERRLVEDAPVLARIDAVETTDINDPGVAGFEIRASEADPNETTLICPDVAVCPDCLEEFLDPSDRRYHYPFINCTNCGPRFSIIEGTPYDRPKTSMRGFRMCAACQSEYDDPLDRRFHAQPNACPECGPRLSLVAPASPTDRGAEAVLGRSYVRMPAEVAKTSESDPAEAVRWLLRLGGIVGVRGLGGFHIAANAELDATVRALREKKNRPMKPFAVMCRTLDVARELAEIGPDEEALLTSPWSPVVLLRKSDRPALEISPRVAPGNAYLGVMLPYAPLHHLLFEPGLDVLIMTSANPSGEPIVATVEEGARRLAGITRTFLDHDRDIVNRNDDSVVFVEGGRPMMSRRSRGYAPYPIDLGADGAEVLACGTELKNTFTILSGGRAFVSQHIGDMENQATLDFYGEMVTKFTDWFRFDPDVVAHDLHPDYLATRYARELGERRGADVRLVGVQHHHAHIASVAAENRVSDPVIGVALDGTGYGTDGKIWGGEFLISDLTGFERVGHLAYVPLPGGDAAIRHPYRVALSHMFAAGVDDLGAYAERLFPKIDGGERDLVVQQIERGINSIDTSSAGRLFDAVSALAGVCHEISYEAQAAIELESLAARPSGSHPGYPYDIREEDGALVVDPSATILAVLDAVAAREPADAIAAAFHETVVSFCREVCGRLRERHGIADVALSGGVFQNRLMLGRLAESLEEDGFTVLLNRGVPANDGGVSLGQAVVASERVRAGLV
jgi:hydrogenase maturation protein HypF